MGEVFSICDDEEDGGGFGGAIPSLGGALLGGAAGAPQMAMGAMSMMPVGDLVLGGLAGVLMYKMFGGNRPKLRLNNPNIRNFAPPPAPPMTQYGTHGRRALLVGINYTGDRPGELRGCINDVKRVAQRLHGHYEIVCLTDDLQDPSRRPTRAGIMQGITWLTSGMQQGGGKTVFFHFSGHGSQQEDHDGDEADGLDETICPVDFKRAGMISDDDLKAHLLVKIPPGNRLLSVMDCCHSGTVLDLPYYAICDNRGGAMQMLGDQMSEKNRIPCDAVMISGCADCQTSADVNNVGSAFVALADPRAGGALTSALLVATLQNPGATLGAMLTGIRQAMVQHGFDQIPQISGSQPYDMNATVFDLFPESFAHVQTAAQRYRPQQQQQQQQRPGGYQAPPQQQMGYGQQPQARSAHYGHHPQPQQHYGQHGGYQQQQQQQQQQRYYR
eukprot:TRINITY_DN2473_c0_g1_i1.p1 TRINITY_DN2473_c0_g1~~TRINITY_DN2473_c0_g1_i1.p1  ORF type:complete len:443 (+),score=153.77 TRINITY_DN2473_c0_g1_i1:90-1418(+)